MTREPVLYDTDTTQLGWTAAGLWKQITTINTTPSGGSEGGGQTEPPPSGGGGTGGAFDAQIFVSPSGSDSNAGTSVSSPKRTLAAALSAALPGQTISVAPGNYPGNFVTTKGGTASGGYITLRGAVPTDRPVISGTGDGNEAAVELNHGYIRIQDMEITGTNSSGLRIGVLINASNIAIVDNEIHNVCRFLTGGTSYQGGGGVDFAIATCSNILIDRNRIHHIGADGSDEQLVHGMYLSSHVTNGRITNNVLHDIEDFGFHCYDTPDSSGWKIINNTVVNTGRGVLQSTDGVTRNNIVFNTTGRAYDIRGTGNVVSNNFYGGTGTGATGTSTGVSSANPLFVDAAADDYRLQAGSPAIDAGTSTDAPAIDHLGAARPAGAAIDLGAYEYGATTGGGQTGGGGGGGGSTGGGSTTPSSLTPPLTLSASINSSRQCTLAWQAPANGTAAAYQVHELRKYPNATLKATTDQLTRKSDALNPAVLEYAIKAVAQDGTVSKFSNTVIVTVTDSGGTVATGQAAGWDGGGVPVTGGSGSTTPDDPANGTGDENTTPTPAPGTSPVPWVKAYPDGTAYPLVTGGGTATPSSSAASGLASIANGAVVNATGTLTGEVTITGKSNITIKNLVMGSGGKLVFSGCTNVILELGQAKYQQAGDMISFRGVTRKVKVVNGIFGPDSAGSYSGSTCQYLYFGDDCQFFVVDKCTFQGKSSSGNALRGYGSFVGGTAELTAGVKYGLASQCLFKDIGPFDENDHEPVRMGVSTMQSTRGHHVFEFCRFENCKSEPEVLSMKMWNIHVRGCTFINCVGGPVARHGCQSKIYDCYMIGDATAQASGSSTVRTSAGIRGYGRGHEFHHLTIRVNGTSKYERPILIDYGDASPDATTNAHATPADWDVHHNLLVNSGDCVVVGKNYSQAPTGCKVRDSWVVNCTNATSTNKGVRAEAGASLAGVAISNMAVYTSASAAGLTTGANGEFKAPAAADRGARTPLITSAMAGAGTTYDPWGGLASGGTPTPTTGNSGGSTGTTTPTPAPGSTAQFPMDLMPDYWYLTTPEWDPQDGSKTWNIYKDGKGSSITANNPDLDTFVRDSNAKRAFKLNTAKTGIIMSADYDGSHTPNSTNTRMELRECLANGKDLAKWSTTSGRHVLDVETQVDALNGNHCVIAQIHGGEDDVTVWRLEGSSLWITDGDTAHGFLVTSNYQLGTKIRIGFDVQSGKVRYYFNGSKVSFELSASDAGCYFKAGCYNQRKGSSGSYSQVTLYKALVTHS